MKKILLSVAVLLIFIACQNIQQRYFTESTEIKALQDGIKAYESGDWNAWKSHFADTAKIYVNSIKPVNVNDRAKSLSQITSAMSSYGFNHDKEFIEMVLDKDNETWVYYWATHKATFAATNKELTVPVHLAVQFVNGKIVQEHVYFDATSMNAEFATIAKAASETETSEN